MENALQSNSLCITEELMTFQCSIHPELLWDNCLSLKCIKLLETV